MEDNFATRLKLFMDTNGLTSSQFADMCGIPRPSISQALSGRNKKINDTLIKPIHDTFPDLSIVWLMFGEGPVKVAGSPPQMGVAPTGAVSSIDVNSRNNTSGTNFKIENSVKPLNPTNESDYPTQEALKGGFGPVNPTKNQIFESDLKILDLQRQIENMKQNPRKVIQITIYYDDSTFETFIPKG